MVSRTKDERGSAVVLLVASLGFFLLGAMGLAIDGAQLYAQRQMAQSAADAAAQAGIVSIFDGGTSGISTSVYYCTAASTTSPCTYASKNGYTAGNCTSPSSAAPGADCIYVNSNPGVPVSPGVLDSQTSPNELQVTITRAVPMTLMKIAGINSLNVTARATAAIVDVTSPVPIIVTHPWMSGSFSGSGSITICGGPQRSIQVNSSSAGSLSASGLAVDLSKAGPADPGNCTTGTGADFGDFGGGSPPSSLSLGTTGHYIQPADPILDPLASVPTPCSIPPYCSTAPGSKLLVYQEDGCPAMGGCTLFYPGIYISTGIGTAGACPTPPSSASPASCTALFSPGIYYLTGPIGGVGVGFNVGAGGVAMMATGVPADPTTGTGMLVYLTGPPSTTVSGCSGPAAQTGTINVAAGGVVNLTGSPSSSLYKGILFFVDRSAAGNGLNTGVHSIAATVTGGGIYATDSVSQMGLSSSTPCGQYQTLQLQGSGIQIAGKVIASALQVNGSMTINLDPNPVTVRQIALVNGE
jgi:hypothetical protein